MRDQHNYSNGEVSEQEAYMRRVLSIMLVLAGIFVNVMTSRSGPLAATDATKNQTVIYGLHVALPNNMKDFPVELVPLP